MKNKFNYYYCNRRKKNMIVNGTVGSPIVLSRRVRIIFIFLALVTLQSEALIPITRHTLSQEKERELLKYQDP